MSEETKVTLVSGDVVEVTSGESASNYIVDGGAITSMGGSVSNIELISGSVSISGGILDGIDYQGGSFSVTDSSTEIHNATLHQKVEISSAPKFYDTVIESGGQIYAWYIGQSFYRTTVNGGNMTLAPGFAEVVTLNSGSVAVNASAIANKVTVNGGVIDISGTSEDMTVTAGSVNIKQGGVVNTLTANGGSVNIKQGGVVNTLTADGGVVSAVGGTISGAILKSGKITMTNVSTLDDSAEGYNITVNGGELVVAAAEMHGTVLNSGTLTLYGNARFFDTTVNGMNFSIWDASQKFVRTTLNSGKIVVSGGSAETLTVNDTADSALLEIYGRVDGLYLQCGSANSTKLFNGARVYGGTVADGYTLGMWQGGHSDVLVEGMEIISGGQITVWGGTVADTVVRGTLIITSGSGMHGEAYGSTVDGGSLTIGDGVVNDTTVKSGSVTVNNGTLNGVTVQDSGSMTVKGGAVADVQITGNGNVSVSGGEMNNVTVADVGSDALFSISGVVRNLKLQSGYSYSTKLFNGARVYGGEIADGYTLGLWQGGNVLDVYMKDMVVQSGGTLEVWGGTVADTVVKGTLAVKDEYGAESYNTTVSGGKMTVSGGVNNGITVSGGELRISGGENDGVTVENTGWLYLADAAVSNVVLKSGGTIYSHAAGATVNNITVAGGKFSQAETTNLTGKLNWDITDGVAGYLSHWERCNTEGLSEISLTVAANQQSGVYKLAEAAVVDTPLSNIDDIAVTVKGLTQDYTLKAGESFFDSASGYTGKLMLGVNEENDKVLTYVTAKGLVAEDCASFSGSDDNLMVDGTVSGLFFSSKEVQENITTTISGGKIVQGMVGGVYAKDRYENDTESVTVNISGGEISGPVYVGGYLYGNNAVSDDVQMSVANLTLNLDGGTVSGMIYVGIHARYYGNARVDNVTINVSGGEYDTVFGGGWAERGGTSYVDNVVITVSGGSIETLYAGGNNAATQSGDAHARARVNTSGITVTNGSVGTIYLSSKYFTSAMTGGAVLTIAGGSVEKVIGSAYGANTTEQTRVIAAANVSGTALSNIDLLTINEGVTFDGSFADIDKIEFALDGELDTDWTALSAESFDSLKNTLFNFNGENYTFELLKDSSFAEVSYNEEKSKYELKLLA